MSDSLSPEFAADTVAVFIPWVRGRRFRPTSSYGVDWAPVAGLDERSGYGVDHVARSARARGGAAGWRISV
jgi:hypothetical protein